MKTYTITLPENIAQVLEVRAAIDNLKPEEGMAKLLQELVEMWWAK